MVLRKSGFLADGTKAGCANIVAAHRLHQGGAPATGDKAKDITGASAHPFRTCSGSQLVS